MKPLISPQRPTVETPRSAAGASREQSADAILGKLSGRSVRCYHCGEWFRAAVRAESASCSNCHRQVRVADVHVRESHWGAPLLSAGRITIHRKASARVKIIAACRGVRIDGRTECSLLISGGLVVLGKSAIFRGMLQAPAMQIEHGAVLDDAEIEVPCSPIGRVELPRSAGGVVSPARPLAKA